MTDPRSRPVDAVATYLATGVDRGVAGPARDRLGEVRRLLASEDMWTSPPPELAETIVARIAADSPVPLGRATARTEARRRPGRRRWTVAGVVGGLAAAAVLVVAMVAGDLPGWGGDGGDGGGSTEVELVATELAPGAAATATLRDTPSGVAITLRAEGLAPAPAGSYYQAWLSGPLGTVAVGTFHVRGGEDDPVQLWSGVDPAAYPTLAVTLEPEDGDPASSGRRVLVGELQ